MLLPAFLLALTLPSAAATQESPPLAQTARLGGGTVGSLGKPALALFGLPVVGEPGPGLAVDGGLPGAMATLVVGLGVDGSMQGTTGATVWPAAPLLQRSALLDALGDSPVWSAGPAPLLLSPGQPVLATADMDGNRRDDVLVVLGSGSTLQVQVHRQLTDGTLAPPVVALLGGGGPVVELATGDVNGDGALDVLCNGAMLGFGDGSFAPRQAGGPAGAVGDWDHDGDLDASDGGYLYLNQAR
jgi:hypothetical protein